MQKIYGIVPADDGTFVQTELCNTQGNWNITQIKRWGVQDVMPNVLLLNKSILLGLKAHWIRPHNFVNKDQFITTASDRLFIACIEAAHYQIYSTELENNLCGVYSDDAYLCTIPLFFGKIEDDSFVSIAKEEQCYKIAIIVNRKIELVTAVLASDSKQLLGHIKRIQRYWGTLNSEIKFPDTTVAINIEDLNVNALPNVRVVSFQLPDINIVKAAGVALCSLEMVVPSFSGPTEGCRFRGIRTLLYMSSLVLVSVNILLCVGSLLLNLYYDNKINKCAIEYNNIIDHNKEIRELMKTGETLVDKFNRIKSVGAQQTAWAQLLEYIGADRPKGLFLEKFGSEPIQKSSDMRIALMGWSESDSLVTQFIRKLNSSTVACDATLASLERDEKNSNICKFKILCRLKSTEK